MLNTTTSFDVYLVKFDLGYYADHQPNYEWSYTDDPTLAKRYKTRKAANERADWGMHLNPVNAAAAPTVATVEVYTLTKVETLVKKDRVYKTQKIK